jgi:hypothetical protein
VLLDMASFQATLYLSTVMWIGARGGPELLLRPGPRHFLLFSLLLRGFKVSRLTGLITSMPSSKKTASSRLAPHAMSPFRPARKSSPVPQSMVAAQATPAVNSTAKATEANSKTVLPTSGMRYTRVGGGRPGFLPQPIVSERRKEPGRPPGGE